MTAPSFLPCSMGFGCDEYGICYAEAHGQPDQCPHYVAYSSRDFDYINRTYGLSVQRGTRVRYTGSEAAKNLGGRLGTVVGADGAYLIVRLDGAKLSGRYHPTWEIELLGTGNG